MTFKELREIKKILGRINEKNHMAEAYLDNTSMFIDGKWGTAIRYTILHKEDIFLIIEVCRYLKLDIFFSSSGIHIQ